MTMEFQILGPIKNLAEEQPELFRTLTLNSDDVTLIINSPGGLVFEGLTLVNDIKGCNRTVTAKINVIAASVAAYIALACDHVEMTKRDILMLHSCSCAVDGNKKQLQETIEQMEAVDKVLFAIASEHCKNAADFAALQQKMNDGQDVWLTGEEAAELFDNVSLVEPEKTSSIAATCDLAALVLRAEQEEAPEDEDEENPEKAKDPTAEEENPESDEKLPEEAEEDEGEEEDNPEEEPEADEEKEEYKVSESLAALLAYCDKLE